MYLCGTIDHLICYQGKDGADKVLDVHGIIDIYMAGDLDHSRSTSGHVFILFGGSINSMSKKHVVAALSTTEVEYMLATHANKEVLWL